MASPTIFIRGIGKFAARLSRLEARAAKTGQRLEAIGNEVTASEQRLASAVGGAEVATATGATETVADLRLAHAFASRDYVKALERHARVIKELSNSQADEAEHLAKLAEKVPAAQRNPATLDRTRRIQAEVEARQRYEIAEKRLETAQKAQAKAQTTASDDFSGRRTLQLADQEVANASNELSQAKEAFKKAKADAKMAKEQRRTAVEARDQAHIKPPATIDDLAEEAAVKAEKLEEAEEIALYDPISFHEEALKAEEAALESAAETVTRLQPLAEAGDLEAQRQIRRIQAMSQRVVLEKMKKVETVGIEPRNVNREGLPQISTDPMEKELREYFAEDRRAFNEAIEEIFGETPKPEFEPSARGDAALMQSASKTFQQATAVEEAASGLTSAQAVDLVNRQIAMRLLADRARGEAISPGSVFWTNPIVQSPDHAKVAWRIYHSRHKLVQADVAEIYKIDEALKEIEFAQDSAQDAARMANQAQKELDKLREIAQQPGADAAAQVAVNEQATKTATLARNADKTLKEYHQAINETNQLLDRVIQSVAVGGAGVAIVSVATEADAAQVSVNESREFYHYSGNELRQANEAAAAAETALDNFSGSEIERLELEAQLASALALADAAQKLHTDAETTYVDARVDKKLSDKEAAEEKAAAEAEARGEAYFKSTAGGMAWEGMKWVGKNALTGLHYAEEGAAYAVDGWGRYGMGLPVDVGHRALAAQDAAIEHVVLPVAEVTYKGAFAETNPMAPLEEAKQREEKAAERFAEASEIRDQDEIDKLAPTPTLITIPDAEPPKPTSVAEAKRKKRGDEAWAKIEEKAQQSLEKNMSLMEEGAPEEESNMSVDPSLAPPASSPRV